MLPRWSKLAAIAKGRQNSRAMDTKLRAAANVTYDSLTGTPA
jgi:hypothetical protein